MPFQHRRAVPGYGTDFNLVWTRAGGAGREHLIPPAHARLDAPRAGLGPPEITPDEQLSQPYGAAEGTCRAADATGEGIITAANALVLTP